MAAKEVWRAANLLTKSWEDGVIVYNLDSGSTHLLNPTAGQVLGFLVTAPANATDLSRRLAAQIDLESDAELDQNVKDLLDQLDSLGLVQAITE
jgi:PqqD family protein of HPr-rel-A system